MGHIGAVVRPWDRVADSLPGFPPDRHARMPQTRASEYVGAQWSLVGATVDLLAVSHLAAVTWLELDPHGVADRTCAIVIFGVAGALRETTIGRVVLRDEV
jgi:hypothetical protein